MVGATLPSGPVLADWRLEPITVALLLGAATVYGIGLARVRRSGDRPSRAAAAAWYAGLAVTAAALVSPIDAYADVSFPAHVVQHLLLMFVAPPLLALGAPIALALRASRPVTARRLTRVIRSGPIVLLANPVVGWSLFVGIPWAVHVSPLFDLALRSQAWHTLEHLLLMGSAIVYWWPIVGADPSAHPMSDPLRLLSLFLAMPAMSFLALSIYGAGAPTYAAYADLPLPWGPGALDAQRNAAVIMWLAGNLALVVAMLLVAAGWKRRDDERQRRAEARLDASVGRPA
jgi:putative membrane protein